MRIFNVGFQVNHNPAKIDIHIILEKVRNKDSYYITWDYNSPSYDPTAIKEIESSVPEKAIVDYLQNRSLELFHLPVTYIEWCEITFKHMYGSDTENMGQYGTEAYA